MRSTAVVLLGVVGGCSPPDVSGEWAMLFGRLDATVDGVAAECRLGGTGFVRAEDGAAFTSSAPRLRLIQNGARVIADFDDLHILCSGRRPDGGAVLFTRQLTETNVLDGRVSRFGRLVFTPDTACSGRSVSCKAWHLGLAADGKGDSLAGSLSLVYEYPGTGRPDSGVDRRIAVRDAPWFGSDNVGSAAAGPSRLEMELARSLPGHGPLPTETDATVPGPPPPADGRVASRTAVGEGDESAADAPARVAPPAAAAPLLESAAPDAANSDRTAAAAAPEGRLEREAPEPRTPPQNPRPAAPDGQLAGAAGTPVPEDAEASTAIAPGMTRAEVVALWGQPISERTVGGRHYLFFANGCEQDCGMRDVVFFEEDAVVDAIVRGPGRRYLGASTSPRDRAPAATVRGRSGNGNRPR